MLIIQERLARDNGDVEPQVLGQWVHAGAHMWYTEKVWKKVVSLNSCIAMLPELRRLLS